MSTPTVDIYEDEAGEHRWRVVAANGETVAQGEGHRDRHDAERAFDTAARIIIGLRADTTTPPAPQPDPDDEAEPAPAAPAVEVYARDECIFNYCPNPETCKLEGCQSPRTRSSGGPIT